MRLNASEGTARYLAYKGTRINKAVLGLNGYGTTQGIQAKQWIGPRNQIDAVNGHIGDELPVDGVTEHLVDAHAILINSKALGQT